MLNLNNDTHQNQNVIYQLTSEQLEELSRRIVREAREAFRDEQKAEANQELGSRKDAAALLGVSMPTIQSLLADGSIRSIYVGSRRLVDLADLRRKIAAGEVGKYHRRGSC